MSIEKNGNHLELVNRLYEKISRIFLKNENNDPEGIMTFRDLFHVALEQGNSDSVLDNSDQSISVVFTRKGFLSDSGFGNTIKAKDVMTKFFESVSLKMILLLHVIQWFKIESMELGLELMAN